MRPVCCQRPHDEGQCWDCPLRSDGGPAFPIAERPAFEGGTYFADGVTVRDYFAAAVMPVAFEFLEKGYCGEYDGNARTLAACAYQLADAMLVERERKP